MEKKWYILVRQVQEGPYTPDELKKHPQVTPDTLAWKEGFATWKAIRKIPELKHLFEEKTDAPAPKEEGKASPEILSNEATLTLGQDPFFYVLLVLLFLFLLAYLFMRLS